MTLTKEELDKFVEHTIHLTEEVIDNLHDIKTEVKRMVANNGTS